MFDPTVLSQVDNQLKTGLGPTDKYELEFRFGVTVEIPNSSPRISNGLPKVLFVQLLNKLYSGRDLATIPYIYSTDYNVMIGKVPHRHSTIVQDGKTISKTIIKQSLISDKAQFSNDYGVKMAFSIERDVVPPLDSSVLGTATFIRTKKRYSIPLPSAENHVFTLDLTEASDLTGSSEATIHEDTKYEIELEVNNFAYLANVNDFLVQVWKLIWNSEFEFPFSQRKEVIRQFNQALNSGNRNSITINSKNVPKAIGLHFSDLTMGGLVMDTAESPANLWVVTNKADGEHRYAVFNQYGIFLIGAGTFDIPSPYSWNKDPIPYDYITKVSNFKFSQNLVLEGELVETKDLKYPTIITTKYILFVFDQILNMTYNFRVQSLDAFIAAQNTYDHITLSSKGYEVINDVKGFYDSVNYLLDIEYTRPYFTDGLVFTPIWPSYAGLKRVPARKWKPPLKQTIDLAIRREANGNYVPYFWGEIDERKLLTPVSEILHIPPTVVRGREGFDLASLPKDTIVECRWNGDHFLAIRSRPDKSYSNSIKVIRDIWNLIQDPITEDTIRGRSFRLVRKFHNRIKRDLFKDVAKLVNRKTATLLDIGSGRGGDLDKVVDLFNQIVLIEPNEANRNELLRRLAQLSPSDQAKFMVLPYQGQDTDLIVNAIRERWGDIKFDVISMMLSLSFFFDTTETLNGLVRTINSLIKDGGYFVYFTIDGETVRNNTENKVTKVLGPVQITADFDTRQVRFVFTEDKAITGDQLEWLVDIPLLERDIGNLVKVPIVPILEPFLTLDEQIYNGFYSYGINQKNLTTSKDMNLLTGTQPSGGLDPSLVSFTTPSSGPTSFPSFTPPTVGGYDQTPSLSSPRSRLSLSGTGGLSPRSSSTTPSSTLFTIPGSSPSFSSSSTLTPQQLNLPGLVLPTRVDIPAATSMTSSSPFTTPSVSTSGVSFVPSSSGSLLSFSPPSSTSFTPASSTPSGSFTSSVGPSTLPSFTPSTSSTSGGFVPSQTSPIKTTSDLVFPKLLPASTPSPFPQPSVVPSSTPASSSFPSFTPASSTPSGSSFPSFTPASSTLPSSTPSGSSFTPASSTPASSSFPSSTPAGSSFTPASSTPSGSSFPSFTPAGSSFTPASSTPASSTPASSSFPSFTPASSSFPSFTPASSSFTTPFSFMAPTTTPSGRIDKGTASYGGERGMDLDIILPDDSIQPLNYAPPGVTGNVVRIGCIGDGHCFIHALLKAYFVPYQNTSVAIERGQMATATRRDLATFLEAPSSKWSGLIIYEAYGKTKPDQLGTFVSYRTSGVTTDSGIDYTLRSLQRHLNSTDYIGDEVSGYIATVLGFNVIIVQATTTGLWFLNQAGTGDQVAIISGDGRHYEVVGLRGSDGRIQTLFPPDHPLIVDLYKRKSNVPK